MRVSEWAAFVAASGSVASTTKPASVLFCAREKRLTDLRAALDANPTARLALVGKSAEESYLKGESVSQSVKGGEE